MLFLSSVKRFQIDSYPCGVQVVGVNARFGLLERDAHVGGCALLIVYVAVPFHVRSPSRLPGGGAPIYGAAMLEPQPQPQAPVWTASSSPSLWSTGGRSSGRQPQDPRCRHPQPGLPLSRRCTRSS